MLALRAVRSLKSFSPPLSCRSFRPPPGWPPGLKFDIAPRPDSVFFFDERTPLTEHTARVVFDPRTNKHYCHFKFKEVNSDRSDSDLEASALEVRGEGNDAIRAIEDASIKMVKAIRANKKDGRAPRSP